MTKRKVISKVQKRLQAVGYGITFDIVEPGVRADGEWWYVPVLSHRNGKEIPRDVTVNIFANVEDEMLKHDHVTVLFVPVVN
jgi:hypothetical protein